MNFLKVHPLVPGRASRRRIPTPRRASGVLLGAACALLLGAGVGAAATPLGGQAVGERLDRRKGDRQLQDQIAAPRMHDDLRSDLMQPQAQPTIRYREWREETVLQPQRFDATLDKQRRVRATLD